MLCRFNDYDVQCAFEACTLGRETGWTFTTCNETDSPESLIKTSGVEGTEIYGGMSQASIMNVHMCRRLGRGMQATVPPSPSASMRLEISEACTVAAICPCTVAHLTQDVQHDRWPKHLRSETSATPAITDEHANN